MPKELSQDVVGTWTALTRAQQTILLKVERALREAEMPPLSWYDVLWELERAGDAGLRPFEIEQRILLAQSNISRLIDRLEAHANVERKPVEADGRGQRVVITRAGREMRRSMWPVYARALSAAIGHRLTEREAATLAALLPKLVDRSQQD
jgi:DNA-binding MarR family transcriptional regulator